MRLLILRNRRAEASATGNRKLRSVFFGSCRRRAVSMKVQAVRRFLLDAAYKTD